MFKEKVVVITGASSGIGRAIALHLAREGACLALADMNSQGLEETLRLLSPETPAKAYVVDVSSRDAVFEFAEFVRQDFGAVHMLINNAGVSVYGTVANIGIDELEKVIAVNLWGVIYGTKAFLPTMLSQHDGCIVNVSSVFGLVATPGQGAYTATKFAVRGFTETLWQELDGTGVRAVLVHPGGIRTGILETTRFAARAGDLERLVAKESARLMSMNPEDCARVIVAGLKQGKPRIIVGPGGYLLHLLSRLLPNRYGPIIRKKMRLP